MSDRLPQVSDLARGVSDDRSGVAWRTSTRCGANGMCVQFAELSGDDIGLRDSKSPDGPVLRFTKQEWREFVAGVVAGEFHV